MSREQEAMERMVRDLEGKGGIDELVRRRLQEILVAAGFDERRVALEVLFWMPSEFVKEYERLFHRALHLGDGDDQEKAGADEGRLVAKVKDDTRARGKRDKDGVMVPGNVRGARGGKKYKLEWVVKDEEALELKKRVDARLRQLVSREMGNLVRVSQGSTPGVGELVEMPGDWKGESVKKRCRDCGKIAKGDWARCPYPHD